MRIQLKFQQLIIKTSTNSTLRFNFLRSLRDSSGNLQSSSKIRYLNRNRISFLIIRCPNISSLSLIKRQNKTLARNNEKTRKKNFADTRLAFNYDAVCASRCVFQSYSPIKGDVDPTAIKAKLLRREVRRKMNFVLFFRIFSARLIEIRTNEVVACWRYVIYGSCWGVAFLCF